MDRTVVIIGAGQAGFQTAVSLRDEGFDGRIHLLDAESGLPYQRPPLSKAYLTGAMTRDGLSLRPSSYLDAKNIDFEDGVSATAVDRQARTVTLNSGRRINYDHLVLATGARSRPLPGAPEGLKGLFSLRNHADADAVRDAMAHAGRVVVIGAGFVGLEFAAVAREKGMEVVIIDSASRPLARAVTQEMSAFLLAQHKEWGVELRLNAAPVSVLHVDGRVTGVALQSDETISSNFVLVGIGVLPNTELAVAAGLPADNGIVVDATLGTADPSISAIGDCAAFPSPFSTGRVRLESVQNAVDQARCVATKIVGRPMTYGRVPWFWSDQRHLKLQIVGLTAGNDETVTIGHPEAGAFSIYCFREKRLLGIETINQAGAHLAGRRLLQAGTSITPSDVAATSFDPKTFVA